MNKEKILLDTDIGDDIDDIFALCLGLQLEKIEFIGITTVYQNTNLRARMVNKVLSLAKRTDIPVYAGIGKPIDGENFKSTEVIFNQATEDLNDNIYAPINDNESCKGDEAVKYIIDSAEKYGKELTIIAIGALTNIAAAIKKAPQTMSKIKKLIFMGGAFNSQQREWNVICDIASAEIVFNANINLECVGLDVTEKTKLSWEKQEYILSLKGTGVFGYLYETIRKWNKSYNRSIVLHDPLTLFYVVFPEILYMVKIPVYLETKGKYGKGVTFNLNNVFYYIEAKKKGKEIVVAKDVDEVKFIDEFMEILFEYKKEKYLC